MRPLYTIAYEILNDWKKPSYCALPYIQALTTLETIDDYYILESGRSIVARFLANAGTWRGETAKRIKAELKSMIK